MTTVPTSWLIRMGVSAAVLAVLFVFIPVRQLWEAIEQLPPAVLAGALAIFFLAHIVAAFKWRLLVSAGEAVSPARCLRAHFAGLVANLCLPGVAGGDVVRAGWIMRRAGRKESVVIGSLTDRAIDVLALLLLGALGAYWLGQTRELWRAMAFVGAVIVVLAAAAAVSMHLFSERLKERGIAGRLLQALRLLLGRPWLLARVLTLSLLVQACLLCGNAWLGWAVGVHVGLAAWFVAWPLAKLTALAPFSLGGIGVREVALIAFMRPFGASPTAVMAAGLLWESVLVTGGVIGWIVMQSLPDEKMQVEV